MAGDNPGDRLFPQVVYFIERLDGTEGFQIRAKAGPFWVKEPIHETITIAALVVSGVAPPAGVKPGDDAAVDEVLRGVLWNEDSDLLLFDEDQDDNWNPSTGVSWGLAFYFGKQATMNDVTDLNGRSHSLDLPFLHAMAEVAGEQPAKLCQAGRSGSCCAPPTSWSTTASAWSRPTTAPRSGAGRSSCWTTTSRC